MKLQEGFVLRQLLGEYIITGDGLSRVDFSKVISLNKTAAWLWEQLQGREFSLEDVVSLMTDHYEVDAETARADAVRLLDAWRHAGLTED